MSFCRFCFDNKIAGPHDHFLRKTKDPNSEVTCPALLNIQCQKCFNYGHTKGYCKINIKTENVKLCVEFDEDGFTIVKSSKPKHESTQKIEKTYNTTKNQFNTY